MGTVRSALRERYACAMSVEIRQSELRNDNAAVMRRVAQGESFVVTVNGRAVADVVPHRPGTGKRRFVPVAELAEAFAAEPAADPTAWRPDLAAADETFGPDKPTDPFGQRRNDREQAPPRASRYLGGDRLPGGARRHGR